MCTLALAWNVFSDTPVVVAANRDESLGRPSTPPRVREWGGHRVFAPRDEVATGTWMGVTETGLFVGVTNRWTDLEGDRSRGLLVRDCLAEPTAASARDHVRAAVEADQYAGFNLLLADRDDCVLLEWDGSLTETAFDPGVHVVVNRGFDDGEVKSRYVRDALSDARTPDAFLERARRVLADHDRDICVHGDGYGTRSSSLVTVSETVTWWFADGPPCETAYERVDGHI